MLAQVSPGKDSLGHIRWGYFRFGHVISGFYRL